MLIVFVVNTLFGTGPIWRLPVKNKNSPPPRGLILRDFCPRYSFVLFVINTFVQFLGSTAIVAIGIQHTVVTVDIARSGIVPISVAAKTQREPYGVPFIQPPPLTVRSTPPIGCVAVWRRGLFVRGLQPLCCACSALYCDCVAMSAWARPPWLRLACNTPRLQATLRGAE